jgi:hypothetical protein
VRPGGCGIPHPAYMVARRHRPADRKISGSDHDLALPSSRGMRFIHRRNHLRFQCSRSHSSNAGAATALLFSGLDLPSPGARFCTFEAPTAAARQRSCAPVRAVHAGLGRDPLEGRVDASPRRGLSARSALLRASERHQGDLTGIENLRVAATLDGDRVDESAIWAALARIGLVGFEDLPTRMLSQGQKKRVALARLILSNAPLWVLDEPFTALDVGRRGSARDPDRRACRARGHGRPDDSPGGRSDLRSGRTPSPRELTGRAACLLVRSAA